MKAGVTLKDLTPREREVLTLVAKGLSSAEAGHALQIDERSVDDHVVNINAKLETKNRQQLVHAAYYLGLIVFTAKGVFSR